MALSVAVAATAAEPAAASEPAAAPVPAPVLVAPMQGSEGFRERWAEPVGAAVESAVGARGYSVVESKALLGGAVVACQTPECVEQSLDAAGAEFAIVPALWVREGGGEELTLTLLQRLGRNLNASSAVDVGVELESAALALLDKLLAQRATAASIATGREAAPAESAPPKHPHAWKAGPILLLAGGSAAFIAMGVGAATKSENQQLNTSAVAAWSAIGAAAIAGGIAWWVVGAKRRGAGTVAFGPTGFDLRLRF